MKEMTIFLKAYQDDTISDIISLAENGKSLMPLPTCIRLCEMATNTFSIPSRKMPLLVSLTFHATNRIVGCAGLMLILQYLRLRC